MCVYIYIYIYVQVAPSASVLKANAPVQECKQSRRPHPDASYVLCVHACMRDVCKLNACTA